MFVFISKNQSITVKNKLEYEANDRAKFLFTHVVMCKTISLIFFFSIIIFEETISSKEEKATCRKKLPNMIELKIERLYLSSVMNGGLKEESI